MASMSKKLNDAVRLYPGKRYELAWRIPMHPSSLSAVLHGIQPVKVGDPRILRLAELLGIPEEEAFSK